MIPRVIHYFWFGENPLPEVVNKCIESWKRYMPEYEIKEWNETNYDVYKCAYTKEAYLSEKWAFVSDYARFDVLYDHGGIYLDTDVELLKPIPDLMLSGEHGLAAMESTGQIAPGLIFAVLPNNEVVKEIIESYKNDTFLVDGKPNLRTVNERVSQILLRYGFVPNNKFQQIKDINIYPSEMFCGFDQDVREYAITENTIAVHHYASTWRNNRTLKRGVQNAIKRIFGVSFYRKLLRIKRSLRK